MKRNGGQARPPPAHLLEKAAKEDKGTKTPDPAAELEECKALERYAAAEVKRLAQSEEGHKAEPNIEDMTFWDRLKRVADYDANAAKLFQDWQEKRGSAANPVRSFAPTLKTTLLVES